MFLNLAAATMLLTALTHSIFGEKLLIGPILALDVGVTKSSLARRVLRFAWHFTSVLMVVSALLVVWPGTPSKLIIVTGAIWLGVGLIDVVLTKGRHMGWPMLTAAGVFAIVGAL